MGQLMERLKKVLGVNRSAGRAAWSSTELGISGKVAGFEQASGQKTISLELYDFEGDVQFKFVRMDLDVAETVLRVAAAGEKFIRAARDVRHPGPANIEDRDNRELRFQ